MKQGFRFVAAIAACLCVLVLVGPAGAQAAPSPLLVSNSSFTQQGQDVVWTLTLVHSFSPAHLARDGQGVCLLFEHRSGLAVGQLCITGPQRGSKAARVSYARIVRGVAGRSGVIAATVTRGSSRELTATFVPTAVGLAYRPLGWQVLTTARAASCAPGLGAPPTCSVRFPARLAVVKLHTPQLVGCVATGNPFVNRGSASQHVIAFTFDDGPWPDTSQFLSILEREHVPATFFEIGDQIATYGEGGAIERRMLADGDMIGDHTWSHPDVAGAGAFAAAQISRTAAALKAVTGFQPCLFRAPYGAVSPALITEVRSMGFTAIQWDIDPRDWARPGTSAIVNNVIGNAHNGAIILQHDGGGDRSQTIAALPLEIAALKRKGYRFETITQLLGYKLIYK